MRALTDKQARVLDVIRQRAETSGLSPTIRELCEALGVSSSCTMQRHLEALERKGQLVQRQHYAYRGYWPVGVPTYTELRAELIALRALSPSLGPQWVELCRFRVEYDPNQCSPNRRIHWSQRATCTELARIAATAAWRQAGEPRSAHPIRLSAIIRRERRLDDDNAIGGLKPVRDALCNGAIVPNDTPDWVSVGTITCEIGPQYRGPRAYVELIIETQHLNENNER